MVKTILQQLQQFLVQNVSDSLVSGDNRILEIENKIAELDRQKQIKEQELAISCGDITTIS
jgi:hypothetical protein